MIYTLGLKTGYEHAFLAAKRNGTVFTKTARSTDFAGGMVFETKEDAHNFLAAVGHLSDYTIYGVIAKWNNDTEPESGKPFHRLLVESEIVRINRMNGE